MTTLAGAIEIQLLADLARLKKDMDAAKGLVGDATRDMQRYADMAKTALGAVGAGLSAVAFKDLVQQGIDAMDVLNDMAIATGVTVETLSALRDIGRMSGTSLESLTGAMAKLARNMSTADEESLGAAQALKALGINFGEFQRMQGDQQLLTLAKAMEGFADGSGKSAAAQALLGREGAKLLPALKDLAGAGELVASVTTEQARMAERYNDSMEATRIRVDALKRDLATSLLPTMNDLHDLTMDLGGALSNHLSAGARSAGGQVDLLGSALGGVGVVMETMLVLGANVGFVFKTMGRDIGAFGNAMAEAQRGNFAGAVKVMSQVIADDKRARAELDAFEKSVLGATDRALQARAALRNGGTSRSDDARELARMDEAAGRAARGQLAFSDATAKAVKAVREQRSEQDKLFDRLGMRSAQQQAELAQGQAVTAAEKEALDLMIRLRDGTLSLSAAEQVRLRQQLELLSTQERHLALRKSEAQLQADMQKDRDQIAADIGADTLRLQEQVAAQRDQNLALKLGADGFNALQVARLRNRADELDSIATTSEHSAELRAQAALLRERAALVQEAGILSASATKPLVNDTYTGVRDALAAAFRDTKNPIRAFADALGNAVFTRVTSSLADAMATQLVGSSGTGGLFGSVLSGLGGLLGLGGVPVGDGTGATGDFARFDRVATPLATGMDYVPHDGFRALLHKGERVVPAAENGGAGRSGVTYAPVTTINVDSRTDAAQVQQMVGAAVAEGNARQLAELQRLGVL